MWKVVYRLLFTRDDDLDLLQVMFLAAILYFFLAFGMAAAGRWSVTTAAWSTFGAIFATLAIAGTPRWVAELIAKSKAPGEVARGIAEGRADPLSPLVYRPIDDPDH